MSTAPRSFSIRFFLPDGTPDGMKIVEKSNWIGQAIACPRAKFADLRKRTEFGKAGVYLLLGQPNPDEPPKVYIGEGDPVGDRLVQQQKQKDFWSSVIFFTSKGENLNKAHVQYLEARLVGLALEVKRCSVENVAKPALPSLSEADKAELEEFLVQMLLICPALGISVFHKPTGADESTELLYLRKKGLLVVGYEAADGFVVRAGSQAAKACVPAPPEHVGKLWNNLVSQEVLVNDGDQRKLAQDYTFSSPSLAAAVMLGGRASGLSDWKDAKGRTLKEIRAAAAAGME
jgi:hypothetical protein